MPLKITHVSTYAFAGGAARAAHRLHTGLRLLGHDSRLLTLCDRDPMGAVSAFTPPLDPITRIKRRWHRHRMGREEAEIATRKGISGLFSTDRSARGLGLAARLPGSQITNLHWVCDLVDYEDFLCRAAQETPLVWTLHDMNPFTGGCHYAGDCDRFCRRCGQCPALGSTGMHDVSRSVWCRKKTVFGALPADRIVFVSPSRWLAQCARASSLVGRFTCRVIPYGVNIEDFAPRDQNAARERLGVDPSARIVLFAAASLADERKGFSLLVEALSGLNVPNLLLVSLGGGTKPEINDVPHVHLGYIEDVIRLSDVYSAADVFAIPARHDNFPNTMLESMACGTPVIAFDSGGIGEAVRDGVTGRLVASRAVPALRECIVRTLSDRRLLLDMAKRCRQIAVAEYSLEVQARRYVDLYQELVGR